MKLAYSELIKIPSFRDRFKYCQLNGQVGIDTFGFDRYLNQTLYRSNRVLIHHLNSITEQDVLSESSVLFDPENLICVSHETHNAIHYGTEALLPQGNIERKPNDMCPWRQ